MKIKLYVPHGYFEYEVEGVESALEHAETIMKRGFCRHYRPERGDLSLYPVYKVKVTGEGLETEYPMEFKRT